MSQRLRIGIALVVVFVVTGIVLGVEALRRAAPPAAEVGGATLPAGSIAIRLDGSLAGSFVAGDLKKLAVVSFVDKEEGKTQEGWLVRDVILLYVKPAWLQDGSLIKVISTGRAKSVQLTWAEVRAPENMVMFDLSGRGTLKLVSVMEKLDTRNEWVQDVDAIEITSP